ncbi:hypothetical protein [Marinilactibacillus psychrotolerans]|uniref:Uncharacterized protein n=1 Tax=Marinilactibacillus psychrotolerans 42ea TaxID=1255609 RepID=A0A1R4ITR4_9LACT|nr:hypothetical protein FM115_02610 [Marinilactibacillus psychrotolerans 42ea]
MLMTQYTQVVKQITQKKLLKFETLNYENGFYEKCIMKEHRNLCPSYGMKLKKVNELLKIGDNIMKTLDLLI